MSEKTTDDDVGLAKTAASVFRCLEFTGTCYHLVLSLATGLHWRDDLVMVNAQDKRPPPASLASQDVAGNRTTRETAAEPSAPPA